VPKVKTMLNQFSIGLFLLHQQPIKIWPNGASILINQLTTVMYQKNVNVHDLLFFKDILKCHLVDSELTTHEYLFYKHLIDLRINALNRKIYD